jgi:hypothetical protein
MTSSDLHGPGEATCTHLPIALSSLSPASFSPRDPGPIQSDDVYSVGCRDPGHLAFAHSKQWLPSLAS